MFQLKPSLLQFQDHLSIISRPSLYNFKTIKIQELLYLIGLLTDFLQVHTPVMALTGPGPYNSKRCRQLIIITLMEGNIRDKYELLQNETIGEGGFAKVIKAQQKKTGRMAAVKIIKKQKMNQEEEILLEREIHIMKNITHPNIVELYDCFEDQKHIYLVLEYLSGGELYDEIAEKVVYTEDEARKVISPIIDALRYLHECGIVHRDLKPQNCVFSSRSQDRVIKLIDFGVSQIIPNDTHLMSSLVGTPLYMAPQMLTGKKYDEEVDWWSIGVILYVLLCGYPPFESDNEVDLRSEILNIGVKFDSADWENVSEEARDLVKRLLQIDQNHRIKVEEIINHPWMLGNADNNHLATVQDNIKKFKSKLRQVRNAIRAVRIMQSLKIGS